MTSQDVDDEDSPHILLIVIVWHFLLYSLKLKVIIILDRFTLKQERNVYPDSRWYLNWNQSLSQMHLHECERNGMWTRLKDSASLTTSLKLLEHPALSVSGLDFNFKLAKIITKIRLQDLCHKETLKLRMLIFNEDRPFNNRLRMKYPFSYTLRSCICEIGNNYSVWFTRES